MRRLLETAIRCFEAESHPYEYSNFHISLPELKSSLREFGGKIPDSQIYDEDPTCGREDDPHVTVRYGAEPNQSPDAVGEAFREFGPVRIKLGKLSVFVRPEKEYDVLKVDVESPDLHRANGMLGELVDFPGETFKDYKPHMTVAYLKKGYADQWVGDSTFEGIELVSDFMWLKDAEGAEHKICLGNRVSESTDTDQRQKTVCFDFDGVCAHYEEWPGQDVFGEPVEGMAELVRELRDDGNMVFLFTTRDPSEALFSWLEENGFEFDAVNSSDHNPEGSGVKPVADLYVDDRGCRFDQSNPTKSIEEIKGLLSFGE